MQLFDFLFHLDIFYCMEGKSAIQNLASARAAGAMSDHG